MYYDDQGRRFNVLSGLLFGALLGAGVTLLATPVRRRPAGSHGGRSGGSSASRVLAAARAALLDAVKEAAPRGGRKPVSP